ncbi:MAG: cytochrome P460 family protein [Myxococcales bacterium]|nr:cytochrome P460 family protein [Myxococcales bacterium]
MRANTLTICCLTAIAAYGCGNNDVGVDDADPQLTSLDAIVNLIEDGAYKSWVKEAAIEDGPGPHGDKLVYFDPLVAQSLADGNATHPRGSTLVKELYEANGDLRGFAIAIKDRDEASRDAWVWYEVFGSDYRDPAFWARGTDSCASCHSSGVDYVITALPPM